MKFCYTAGTQLYTRIHFHILSIIVIGYWVKLPVLYRRTLFVHPGDTSLHLLVPNSQSFPTSEPTEHPPQEVSTAWL